MYEAKPEKSFKKSERTSDLIRFKDDEDEVSVQDDSVDSIPEGDSFGEVNTLAEPVDETLAMLEKAERDFENSLDAFSDSIGQLFDLLEKIIVNSSEQVSEQNKDGR